MASVGDVVQIKVFQTCLDQLLVNSFYYRIDAGASPSVDDLLSAFKDDVWDVVRALVTAANVTTKYEAINGMDNAEFEVEEVTTPGTNAGGGAVLPAQIAAVFRSPNAGPGTRYSYRAFSGFTSSQLEGTGGTWDNTQLDELDAVCVALGAILEGANGLYTPVQLTGGFRLGTPPDVGRTVVGNWLYNYVPGGRRTRQSYNWTAVV